MKCVQLAAVSPGRPLHNNQILLAEKDGLDRLDAVLSASEAAFLRQGASRDINTFFFPRVEGCLFVRLLKPDKNPFFASEDARLAGSEIQAELRRYKVEAVAIRNFCTEDQSLTFAEGLVLANYQFLKYFSDAGKKENSLREVQIEGASGTSIEELNQLLDSVYITRDMVNEPHSNLNAVQLAEMIEGIGSRYGFGVEVLGKEKIQSLKMGGLLAVNRASSVPPQFCILEWKPDNAHNAKPVVLVGKGVVYDTGGLSLKPTEGMDYMKCDMAGAATVVGTLAAVARNRLPIHLVGLIPATDNQIGEHALAPGDVIRMYSGKTVEVLNTDAEGRIILADALHYAKKYDPELVLDLATLTGSAVRALGTQAICYMGTAPQEIKTALETSGWTTYERLMEFPLWREFGDDLKSHIADIKNIGSSNAGMITAGKFLEHFAGDYPWLHLDIAGPAYLRTANGYRTKEGTGVGVRLLYDFLRKQYVKR